MDGYIRSICVSFTGTPVDLLENTQLKLQQGGYPMVKMLVLIVTMKINNFNIQFFSEKKRLCFTPVKLTNAP